MRGKDKKTNSQNVISQMRFEGIVFDQRQIPSIGHNVDLELTLLFLLGPVLQSLSTPDGIPTKRTSPTLCMSCNQNLNQK